MAKKRELKFEERVAIINLRKTGLSFQKIAIQMGCNKSTACRIVKKYKLENSAEKGKRCGRPQKFFPRGERFVCRAAKRLRFENLKNISRSLESSFQDKTPSKTLVRRILRKYNIKSCIRTRKTYITPQNRARRAKAVSHWTQDEWREVVFSDESRFGLSNDYKTLRVWRTPSEAQNSELCQTTVRNTVSVMFWGCIGPSRVGNLVVCNKVNAEKYCSMLQDNLFKSGEKIYGMEEKPFIFQQDNATPHTAKHTKVYLKLRKVPLLPWPAQSPDINIIENIWLYMKRRINNNSATLPKTKDQLIARVQEEWSHEQTALLVKIVLDYKTLKTNLCQDWESIKNRYEEITTRFRASYPRKESGVSPEEFPKYEDTSVITKDRVSTKVKRIKTSFRKAVDSGRRSGGGRVVTHLYDECHKIWAGSPAVDCIENGIATMTELSQGNSACEETLTLTGSDQTQSQSSSSANSGPENEDEEEQVMQTPQIKDMGSCRKDLLNKLKEKKDSRLTKRILVEAQLLEATKEEAN
eukprot:gene10159-11199_t